ncbi:MULTISPECIES: phosphatidylglycerophosphatase A family protein [Fibrobacter]|uniref:Phosphatidylglycerophosphatase A n=1 Tax=Fibrobacter intestinalis TaxID=28122 RepID=A0A1T4NXZ5_9BACT|nr:MULTISPECIES: phosphatidylglycerophosphatase A [Fibrobacter]PBC67286.1 phosphatidylglycerophosphatase [Fibrobacter sp. UWS1]PBC72735.1 phosphatidylglycerophosphatase [Fibrobacter sp. NR9]SJZ83942.1 phosphatidylglycerophosphatase A [Fibrobacter intestinalis]
MRKTDKFTLLVVTFFGSGFAKKAPGTFGSLLATLLSWPLLFVSFPGCFALLAVLTFFVAIPFVNKAMADSQTEDPGWIVIDEAAGIFTAFAFVSPETLTGDPWMLALGFALFRFFDILKPLGIHRLEKLPRAWGVMADDILGGIYSGICLLCVERFLL